MDFLIKNLEENTKKIALFKAIPLYELLLSIEKAYQENESLIAFSYKYTSEYKKSKIESMTDDVDLSLLKGSIKAYPIDEDGIETFLIKDKGLHYISIPEYGYYLKDKEALSVFNRDFLNVLKSFSNIKNRESRFDIYEDFFHGKMPGYSQIINSWKNGDITNIVNSYPGKIFPESVNLKSSISLDNYIEISKCLLDKYLFMLSFAKKKELFFDHPEIESFCEGIEVDRAYNESILKITGKGSRYEKDISEKDHLKISSVAYDEKTYKIKERFYFDDLIRNIETKRNSLFSDSLFLDFFKISKEEASLFDTMLERHELTQRLDENPEISVEVNKKRL